MAACEGIEDIENSVWFKFVDQNDDDRITRAEFHTFLKKVTDDDVKMFEQYIHIWQKRRAAAGAQ